MSQKPTINLYSLAKAFQVDCSGSSWVPTAISKRGISSLDAGAILRSLFWRLPSTEAVRVHAVRVDDAIHVEFGRSNRARTPGAGNVWCCEVSDMLRCCDVWGLVRKPHTWLAYTIGIQESAFSSGSDWVPWSGPGTET